MRLELSKSVIRPFASTDAESITKHWDNRNLWLNLNDGFPHPFTLEAAQRFLSDALASPQSWLAIEVDGEAVGAFHVTIQPPPKHHSASVGYWIGERYWRRGSVTEALEAVTAHFLSAHNLTRMFAYVFEGNVASMRVLEKCGYEREGWLRQGIMKNGRAIDQALYAKIANR